ncbi:MAG: hypothetical protein L0H93_20625 [Nocardioides sp.]|nr:hypothetical protein [Nocardioides sp.]
MKRITSSLVAIPAALALSAALAPAAQAGTAPASTPDAVSGTATTSAARQAPAMAAARKPRRPMTFKITQKGRRLFAHGHIGPKRAYKNRKVVIQKARKCGPKRCFGWHKVHQGKTNRKANYRIKIHVPHNGRKHYFRVLVPRFGRYGVTVSNVRWVKWL